MNTYTTLFLTYVLLCSVSYPMEMGNIQAIRQAAVIGSVASGWAFYWVTSAKNAHLPYLVKRVPFFCFLGANSVIHAMAFLENRALAAKLPVLPIYKELNESIEFMRLHSALSAI